MRIVVLDYNENSLEVVKAYLEQENFNDIALYRNYKDAVIESPDTLVIADMSSISDTDMQIVGNIKLKTEKLIITSENYSADSIVQALRIGAKEFIQKPVIKNDLINAVKTVISDTGDSCNTKIISVYSNKGGIGKTTIAVNLAAELSRIDNNNAALIDLNLQLGDISTFLNLSPAFDVSYAARKITKNTSIQVENLLERYKNSSLYVLSDPSYIEQFESMTPQLIQNLFANIKKKFKYIVVDLSSNIDPITLKILDLSDWIFFTSIVTIPSIRNAQRCLNLFKSRKYPDKKVKLIINRYMENDEIKVDDIENTLDKKVYWKIPNNYFTIMEAINRGVSVWEINPNSNIAANFRDFATKVSDDIIEESVISNFRRL